VHPSIVLVRRIEGMGFEEERVPSPSEWNGRDIYKPTPLV
jgi:hypothetical protein